MSRCVSRLERRSWNIALGMSDWFELVIDGGFGITSILESLKLSLCLPNEFLIREKDLDISNRGAVRGTLLLANSRHFHAPGTYVERDLYPTISYLLSFIAPLTPIGRLSAMIDCLSGVRRHNLRHILTRMFKQRHLTSHQEHDHQGYDE